MNTTTPSIRTSIGTIAIAACVLQIASMTAQAATPVATAEPSPGVVTVSGRSQETVSYGDLNLSTAKGVDALTARLKTAAENTCGRPYRRNLEETQKFQKCRDAAFAEAMIKVNALHDDKIVAAR